MKKSVRGIVWVVACCILLVSSLGVGVAQSASDNTTNGTQSVAGTDDQNNHKRVENALESSNASKQNQAVRESGANSTNESNKKTGAPGNQNKNGTNSSLVAFARRLKSKDVSTAQANKILGNSPQKAKKFSDTLEKMGYSHPEYTNPNSNKAKYPKEAAKFYLDNVNSGNKDKDKGAIDKMVSKGFKGLLDTVEGWMSGAVNMFSELIYGAATYTPHPNNVDNWFQNPQNSVWPDQWHTYKTVTRPLSFLLLILATGLYYGFGSNSLHVMDAATEQVMKRRLLVGWIMFPVGWSLGSLYLNVMHFITEILGRGMTSPNIDGGLFGDSLAILVIIAVVVFEFWTVLLILMLIGLRIVALVGFLPFLPLVFALRAIPIVSISNGADAIIHLWVYLALLPIPMGVLIAIGFSGDLADMIMGLDIGGAILLACIKMGALVGAIVVPFAMYQKMKEHGLATGFGSDGTVPGDKLKEGYKRQRETASRRHQQYENKKHSSKNFYRGARGRPEIDQGGQTKLDSTTRAHRWGSRLNRGGGGDKSDGPDSQLEQGGGGKLD